MAIITQTPQASLAPPLNMAGWRGWVRTNLFSSPLNSIVTVLMFIAILMAIIPLINWALIKSDWAGTSRDACTSGGACWVFVKMRFHQFVYGLYPATEYWRVNIAMLILAIGVALLVIKRTPGKKWIVIFMLTIFPVAAFFLLHGSETFNLPMVETRLWGGFMLTLVLSVTGIVTSLPLGILLALGRRSNMPIIRMFSVAFIELWRGVPLVSVLFMASVMLQLFLPTGVNFDKLLRAMICITLFQSAYIAEVVRSGLQAIPKGQYEAAAAMGLNYWQSTGLIVLPQALKLVIPGLVNNFISLFKDTTLVSVIGIFDLLGIIQAAITDPEWIGYRTEGFIFAAALYWVFCFSMSRYSLGLERQLNTSHKR